MANTPHWKVRPYAITGGRAVTRQPLLVHTLVSMGQYDPVFAANQPADVRAVYEGTRTTCSVAELSALAGLPLGVVRVIIDDLAASERVVVQTGAYRSAQDPDLLERLRNGLRKFA